jgi:serine protease inhibitor
MVLRCLLVVGFVFEFAAAISPLGRGAWASEPTTKAVAPTHVIGDAIQPIDQGSRREEQAMSAIVEGNNRFATDLYLHLKDKTSGNLFFSPYSISTALAMTYAGAAGETGKQMAEVLHLTVPERELQETMARLREKLLADKETGYQLRVANRLWGQKGYEFLAEFLQTTQKYYGAELGTVDFAHNTEAARLEINQWVERQTNDKIKDLFPPGVLDALTRLVLTNAIYFKGNWQEKFQREATKDTPFHVSADTEVTVPMMHRAGSFGYQATEDLQILEMPYSKGELSMIVFLPKEIEGLPQLEKKVTQANLQEWAKGLRRQKVITCLPRFKMTSQFGLKDTLQAMGMTRAFEKADFSRMSPSGQLFISAVVHKAFLDVNEEGTEAAGATGVAKIYGAAPPRLEKPPVFRADHPFLFLIRDNQTGSILFLGRVVNPSERANTIVPF